MHDTYNGDQMFRYNDPFLVSGVLRAVVAEDLEKIGYLLRSGQSVNINDNNGNTPIHVAVIKKNLSILKYLLAEEDIVINARNFLGQTPLFIAVKIGCFELAHCLVNSGANVNLSNLEDVTPLHVSVPFPNIAHLLITNGAYIDALDFDGDSPLHDAVMHRHLETACMLLFYNADANIRGDNNLTPFMRALIIEDIDLQDILFEYVNDFNISTSAGVSTLSLALSHENHYVEEIINRGAEVKISAFCECLHVPKSDNFKWVWRKLSSEEAEHITVQDHLLYLLDIHQSHFQAYLGIILEDTNSSVLDVLAENIQSHDLVALICRYAHYKLVPDELTKFICLLLQHSIRMSSSVIYEVFINYGYCELFRLLLFMEYIREWSPLMITPRLIFDIETNIKTKCFEKTINCITPQLMKDLESSFGYWVYRPLIDFCQTRVIEQFFFPNRDAFSELIEKLPKVPSLLELARDQAREYIVKKRNHSTTCQYYTFVNHLDISPVYKKILMYEKKLYDIEAHCDSRYRNCQHIRLLYRRTGFNSLPQNNNAVFTL